MAKSIELSEKEIVDAYWNLVGRSPKEDDSPLDEFGNFKKFSMCKESDVHYSMNAFEPEKV